MIEYTCTRCYIRYPFQFEKDVHRFRLQRFCNRKYENIDCIDEKNASNKKRGLKTGNHVDRVLSLDPDVFFIVNILNCIPVCPWTCKTGFFPYWAYIRTDDVLSQSAVLDYHLDVNNEPRVIDKLHRCFYIQWPIKCKIVSVSRRYYYWNFGETGFEHA